MKRHLPAFVVGCLLTPLTGCSTPETGPAVFEHDGLERSYHLHAPRDRPEEAPLVVVMHGYAAGASALRRLMRSARAMRMQNRVFGGLLMAVGAGLFFVKRGGQHA